MDGFVMGSAGLDGVEGVFQTFELRLDVFEPFHDLEALIYAVAIGSDLRLSRVEFKSFLLDQIVDFADGLDVARRVETDVFSVTPRFNDGELRLPIAQCGHGNIQYLRHITYLIEFLVQFLHSRHVFKSVVRHIIPAVAIPLISFRPTVIVFDVLIKLVAVGLIDKLNT